jgi:hypothetical protein
VSILLEGGVSTCRLLVAGGKVGFDKVLWSLEPADSDKGSGARLQYTSPDGEEVSRLLRWSFLSHACGHSDIRTPCPYTQT